MSLLLDNTDNNIPEKCPNCGNKMYPFKHRILGDKVLALGCDSCYSDYCYKRIAVVEIWEETSNYSYRAIAKIEKGNDTLTVVQRDYLSADVIEASTDILDIAFTSADIAEDYPQFSNFKA